MNTGIEGIRFHNRRSVPIRIAISSDARGFGPNATLLASILRRTERPVQVRCWCRGFLPDCFESGPLKVEFLPAEEEATGTYPGYVGPAVFDRLRVIREAVDWDRCLIMDYDQLALCDLAPLFEMDLGDKLLAARMQGPGIDMAYAMRTWIKRPLPEGWEHVAAYPYFSMGPLLNLKAMREAGTWEKLVAAHAAFGMDEQLSLTAATEGRTTGFDVKWNLFPKQDICEGEVPVGVVHWLGWPKPWHPKAKVWRPDIWEAERASWEHLRMGLWEKPVSLELEPEDGRAALALARRGWRVKVFSSGCDAQRARMSVLPDLQVLPASSERFQQALEEGPVDQVRLGAWEDPAKWLDGLEFLPRHLVLRGAVEVGEVDRVRALGYEGETRLISGEWPEGGPLPRVLEHGSCRFGTAVGAGEDLYLQAPDRWVGGPLTVAGRAPRVRMENAKRVGLCVTATGNERTAVRPLLRSVRANFLPGHEVTVFLFTDREMEESPGLRVMPVGPGVTGGLYGLLVDQAAQFASMDHLYHLGIDMRVVGKVGEEIFGELVATLHPGFHDRPREAFSYEDREASTACVRPGEGERYFAGGFQGGRVEAYLGAARVMAERIAADAAKGITARWRDESHWNRYLIDHEPGVVLPPSYCWYPDGRLKQFEGKIAVVPEPAAARASS